MPDIQGPKRVALGVAIIGVRGADMLDILLHGGVSFACVAQCLPVHQCAARDDVVNRCERVHVVVEMAMFHTVIEQDMSANGNDGLYATISAVSP